MTTNPNNAVGTNGAFGGRTSVNAFNDGLAAYSGGILSGWACSPSSGLTVVLGGNGDTRDVAIAEDNAGNKTTINNISGSPIAITLENAPSTNSRIDAIVAYVDNPPTGSSTATDNYGACGLIAVQGTVASSPSAPTDSAIRTAITADGASGTTAYYVVLANITIANGTTDIDSTMIIAGNNAAINSRNIGYTTMPSMVTANFGSGNTSSTNRILLKQASVSGLDTGWEYLCILSVGLLYAYGGSSAVAFMDLSIESSATVIIPSDRIRGNGLQTTITYAVPFTPPSSSFTVNLNGRGSSSGESWENAVAYFIPIRPNNI